MRGDKVLALIVTCVLVMPHAIADARSLPTLTDFLARSDGATDHVELAAALDELRAMGKEAAPADETLTGLLRHRANLYRDRDKVLVVRLRSQIFVTLTDIGFPDSAMPALYDTLVHVDERIHAREVGAAARVVGSLGPRGRELAPYLVETLALQLGEEEFSLERYDAEFPPEEATTLQLEAVRALAAVATPEDRDVLRVLRQLAESGADDLLDPRVVREAQRAVEIIEGGRR